MPPVLRVTALYYILKFLTTDILHLYLETHKYFRITINLSKSNEFYLIYQFHIKLYTYILFILVLKLIMPF
jgi:hypothetical protein